MPATETQGLAYLIANLGFAATMCLLVFVAYQKLVNRLADIIKENTQAMTALQGVIAALSQRYNRPADRGRER